MNAVLRGLVILFVGGLAVAAYFGARHWQDAQNTYQRVEDLDGGCELQLGSCRFPLEDGGLVAFSIEPASIPLMQTLELAVRIEGLDVDGVQVDIRGLNMEMGLNRTRLQELGDGRWGGETILPICSQRRMIWEAAVQLDGTERLELPFRFETLRP